ncbi:LPD1 domain-containing protein [Acinetobacter sp. Marseille-Q1618]|uniref:LPD1 domain-containing protein n=1 Tax=Acinetobacter sp. Marseille-Q1618 TaxID=2697502 RepID=UPI00156D6986|nr:LPD1 domain-containing protein [Acinetobacter sp. Marseille-Q1618]
MKWLSLKEFGLKLGYRNATSYRPKLAIINIEDNGLLQKNISVNELENQLKKIGYNRVNSADGTPKYVKTDEKIQPKDFVNFLPVTNNHIIDIEPDEALAKFSIEKEEWIDFAKIQSYEKGYWKVDSEYQNKLFNINKTDDLFLQLHEFDTVKNEKFIDLGFENPLPVTELMKYGYDSSILGVITANKDRLIDLGIPLDKIQPVSLELSLPVMALKNESMLIIDKIKGVPELLEYSPIGWNLAVKVQNANVELEQNFSKFISYNENLSEEKVKELFSDLNSFMLKNHIILGLTPELEDLKIHILNIEKSEYIKQYYDDVIGNLTFYNNSNRLNTEVIKPYQVEDESLNINNDVNQNKSELISEDISEYVVQKEPEKQSINNERIEDFGEVVYGAKKHLYVKSIEDIRSEIESGRDQNYDLLIDKFKKTNIWNFNKETKPELIDKSNELFFLSQSIYNLLPNRLSLKYIESKHQSDVIDYLKDYTRFIGHIKEIVHEGIDNHERYPISQIPNKLIDYYNVVKLDAQHPLQFQFDELNSDLSNSDTSNKNISNIIYGTKTRGSPFYKLLEELQNIRATIYKGLLNKFNPEIGDLFLSQFIEYSKTGGRISEQNRLRKFDLPDYKNLHHVFERSQEVTGADGFLNMLLGEVQLLQDQAHKAVKKLISQNEILPYSELDREKISFLSYRLQLFRLLNDSNFKIDNDLKVSNEDRENESENLNASTKFERELRIIIKADQVDRLDLRYPEILQDLTHQHSQNFRGDKDISIEQYGEDIGFRAVQFGNWVTQNERQELLNISYDGLNELTKALNIELKDISLGGELAIAFGARGKAGKGAAAHYESNSKIFNLTKKHGAGAVAHEWFHGLDHFMAEQCKDDLKKLIYKSGNINLVERNYFLTELMTDVDYKQSHVVIDNNPILKSFYDLQLKLNGKMQSDEIFSNEGVELIKSKFDEIISDTQTRIFKLKDQIVNALKNSGQDRIANLINDLVTKKVNTVEKVKDLDFKHHLNTTMFTSSLGLNRTNVAGVYRRTNNDLNKENIPFGSYTISNPITEEYNRLPRNSVLFESEKNILLHLRMHKVVKQLEKDIHTLVFQNIQKKIIPDVINILKNDKFTVYTEPKYITLKGFIDYTDQFYTMSKTKKVSPDFNIDLIFNKNNFSNEARRMDLKENSYWSRPCEKFARCGEAFITDLFKERNVKMGYIVQCMEDPKGNRKGIVPSGVERHEILKGYEVVFDKIREYLHEQKLQKHLKQSQNENHAPSMG